MGEIMNAKHAYYYLYVWAVLSEFREANDFWLARSWYFKCRFTEILEFHGNRRNVKFSFPPCPILPPSGATAPLQHSPTPQPVRESGVGNVTPSTNHYQIWIDLWTLVLSWAISNGTLVSLRENSCPQSENCPTITVSCYRAQPLW